MDEQMNGKNIFFLAGCATILLLAAMFHTAIGARTPATYTNPVLVETVLINRQHPDNFSGLLGIGDPTVIFHEGTYYLYPTGDNRGYDVYLSEDLVNWRKGPRVFQSAERGVWAPDVFYNEKDGIFYLYYTANGHIGVATSEKPYGTFRDRGPLIENAIDAHMFLDDDEKYYLYYVQYPGFRIHVQPMANPLQKKGVPVQLIQPGAPWEKRVAAITEAPWMLKHSGLYYLLYSAGGADSQDYAIGYATAQSPQGPFSKFSGNPVIGKGNNIFGPGHCAVTSTPDGQLWMVYHQQKDASRGWNRIICIDPLSFDDEGILRIRASRGEQRPAPTLIKDS